jgi:hypothetical protein
MKVLRLSTPFRQRTHPSDGGAHTPACRVETHPGALAQVTTTAAFSELDIFSRQHDQEGWFETK